MLRASLINAEAMSVLLCGIPAKEAVRIGMKTNGRPTLSSMRVIAFGLDGDGLRRLAVAAIQEGVSGRYSSARIRFRIVHDADERSNRIFAIRPASARSSSRFGRPDGLPDCPGPTSPQHSTVITPASGPNFGNPLSRGAKAGHDPQSPTLMNGRVLHRKLAMLARNGGRLPQSAISHPSGCRRRGGPLRTV